MDFQDVTVSLCWMQTLNGAVEVLEQGIPISQALMRLQEQQAQGMGVGSVAFLMPENQPGYGGFLIAQERRRQVEDEGYSAEHDAQHDQGELLQAAVAYVLMHSDHAVWPWEPSAFKPKSPVQDLVRAGALIAAEIDRRLAGGES